MTNATDTTLAPPPLELESFWNLIDRDLMTKYRSVTVTGSLERLRRGRRYAYGELVATDKTYRSMASINVGIFLDRLARLEKATSHRLVEGSRVEVVGRLQTDRRYGKLRIHVDSFTVLDATPGGLGTKDASIAELRRLGLLRRQRELPLAHIPLQVGLISSPTSAGRADFHQALDRAGYPGSILEQHIAMSGPAVRDEFAVAVKRLAAANVEIIVVTRGGGSHADISAWNDLEIATAIASSDTPVWTAVGHATDRLIVDRVANRSWPTPTAAGQALASRYTEAVQSAETETRRQAIEVAHAETLRRSRRNTRIAVAAFLVLLLVVVLRGVLA